ncbi:MAG: hypothetical protein AAF413_03405 [Patescibacteria group bacterium]
MKSAGLRLQREIVGVSGQLQDTLDAAWMSALENGSTSGDRVVLHGQHVTTIDNSALRWVLNYMGVFSMKVSDTVINRKLEVMDTDNLAIVGGIRTSLKSRSNRLRLQMDIPSNTHDSKFAISALEQILEREMPNECAARLRGRSKLYVPLFSVDTSAQADGPSCWSGLSDLDIGLEHIILGPLHAADDLMHSYARPA